MLKKLFFVLLFCLPVLLQNCKKDPIITDPSAMLAFSTDTLSFDTVFTTIGSTTGILKIYNRNNKTIEISSIILSGGNASQFRMNVDGIASTAMSNIQIGPNDSLYIFVEVTVDPTSGLTPFLITDEILFVTNGNKQQVTLAAYGQDAHFYNGAIVCNEVWTNDKPYVILNSMLVDSGCSLTIQQGVQVFCGGGTRIFVNPTAQLIVQGSVAEPVVFQGIRLESYYDDLPGQWDGIHFLKNSVGNTIENAIIEEAVVGVRVDSFAGTPNVSLKKTIIRNMLSSGILGLTANIDGENLLMYNCGQNVAQLEFGGYYDFRNCTFANFSSSTINHKTPILRVSNYFESNNVHSSAPIIGANFTNCIVYGSESVELDLDDDGLSTFDFLFENCLLKTDSAITGSPYINTQKNLDPLFVDYFNNDFHVKTGSPAIDAGKTLGSIIEDLEGNSRPTGVAYDIGAYEQ